MPKAQINYTVDRGEVWERLIVLKDRRSRRKRVPTEVAATVLIDEVKYVIPASITSEGAVLLSMSSSNTEWLTNGEYAWDMVATVSRSALLTSSPLMETVVVYGTLYVQTYENITPMDSDGVTEPLEVLA